jgi:hypothetical protein
MFTIIPSYYYTLARFFTRFNYLPETHIEPFSYKLLIPRSEIFKLCENRHIQCGRPRFRVER